MEQGTQSDPYIIIQKWSEVQCLTSLVKSWRVAQDAGNDDMLVSVPDSAKSVSAAHNENHTERSTSLTIPQPN